MGFGGQHILARPVGPRKKLNFDMSASRQMVDGEGARAPNPITYEDLPPEHQQKFNELLEIFKADLIGSYE